MEEETAIHQEIRAFDRFFENLAVGLIILTSTGFGAATIYALLPLALRELK